MPNEWYSIMTFNNDDKDTIKKTVILSNEVRDIEGHFCSQILIWIMFVYRYIIAQSSNHFMFVYFHCFIFLMHMLLVKTFLSSF